MAYLAMLLRSGLQRASRSGRGFPTKSFSPCVDMKTPARATTRPNQPAFHSQNLRRMICDQKGFCPSVSAVHGGSTHAPNTMMTAGANKETRTRVLVETVSTLMKGKEMFGSAREKTW